MVGFAPTHAPPYIRRMRGFWYADRYENLSGRRHIPTVSRESYRTYLSDLSSRSQTLGRGFGTAGFAHVLVPTMAISEL